MEITKRQRQVGRLIQEELTDILHRGGFNMIDGGMVSISGVVMTPDLLEARIYLSFLNIKEKGKTLEDLSEKIPLFRGQLGNRLRHQLRRIPELQFFEDDSLDRVFRLEEIFKKLHEEDNRKNEQ